MVRSSLRVPNDRLNRLQRAREEEEEKEGRAAAATTTTGKEREREAGFLFSIRSTYYNVVIPPAAAPSTGKHFKTLN